LPDILALIDDEKVGRLIVRADPDDTVTFIDSLPGDRRERVLALLDPVSRAAVREIINYLDGTVRRLKTTHFMALPPATTAQSAIALGELELSSAWRAILKHVSVNICIAIAAGAVIPLLLKTLKFDPAPGSGVIVPALQMRLAFFRASVWRPCSVVI
jgi:Mg/Co/Ni transporter MgtE